MNELRQGGVRPGRVGRVRPRGDDRQARRARARGGRRAAPSSRCSPRPSCRCIRPTVWATRARPRERAGAKPGASGCCAQESVDAAERAPVAGAARAARHLGRSRRERARTARRTIYNALLIYAPDGTLALHHRKLVPTNHERLVWGQGDGRGLEASRRTLGLTGGLICWENWMPLARFALYERGVETYLALDRRRQRGLAGTRSATSPASRARSSLSCLRVPERRQLSRRRPARSPGRRTCTIGRGGSAILAPDGSYLAGPLWDEAGILFADLDPASLYAARQRFDPAGHYHRPDVLSLTVTPQAGAGRASSARASSARLLARELALRDWDVTLVEQHTPGYGPLGLGRRHASAAGCAHGDAEWYTGGALLRARTLWPTSSRRPAPGDLGGASASPGSPAGSDGPSRAASVPVSRPPRDPHEWPRPTDARGAVPVARRGTTWVRCPLRAGCGSAATRAAPPSSLAAERRGVEVQGIAARAGRRSARRRRRLGVRRLAATALPRARRRSRCRGATSSSSAATAPGGARPASVDYDGGFYGHGDVGGLGIKIAPDSASDTIDPDTIDRVPSPYWEEQGAELRRPALPIARRGTGARWPRLPVRHLGRHSFHRRPPPGARPVVARGRRLRSQLQTRAGPRRVRRRLHRGQTGA